MTVIRFSMRPESKSLDIYWHGSFRVMENSASLKLLFLHWPFHLPVLDAEFAVCKKQVNVLSSTGRIWY
jgi:hypothetical protein